MSETDTLPQQMTAIEIDSPDTWQLLCNLEPHMNELSYEANYGSFLVFNLPSGPRWALLSPATVAKSYSAILPGTHRIKTVTIVR